MNQRLFYRIEGKGDTIVLLHGFLASSHYFKPLSKRLSQTHRVISIDLLGFGRSPKPRTGFTYKDHVRAVNETLRSLNVTSFTLVGHSLGSLIAMRYAITYPQKVKQLILFNPPMYRSAAQAFETLAATGLHYRIMLHSPLKDVVWYGAKILPRLPFNAKRPPINLTDVLRAGSAARKQTYQNIILAGEFFNDIERLQVPTLLVVGKNDRPQYMANAKQWQPPKHVRAISVVANHHFPVRNPSAAEKLVRSHLLT